MSTVSHTFNRGFTIVELLIVIVIIGILASVTVVSFRGVQQRAHDTAVQSDMSHMQTAQSLYVMAGAGVAKAYYSGATENDPDLEFRLTKGNVIDVVAAGSEFCIRGYNPKGSKKTIAEAFTRESNAGVCAANGPSSAAGGGGPTVLAAPKLTDANDDSFVTTIAWEYPAGVNGTPPYTGSIVCPGRPAIAFTNNGGADPLVPYETGAWGLTNAMRDAFGCFVRDATTTIKYQVGAQWSEPLVIKPAHYLEF